MKIKIPHLVYQKMMFWVHKADFEVSGMGSVSWNEADKSFEVHDVCLVKQQGTGGSTDIDPAALAKAQFELRDAPGQLSFWWHSHVNMQVFMSGTDQATCKELGRNGYCVALVLNKRNELHGALAYSYTPSFGGGTQTHYMEKIPVEVVTPGLPADLVKQLEKEFKKKVKQKVFEYGGRPGRWDRDLQRWVDDVPVPVSDDDEDDQRLYFSESIEPNQSIEDWLLEKKEADVMGMSLMEYRKYIKNCTPKQEEELYHKLWEAGVYN